MTRIDGGHPAILSMVLILLIALGGSAAASFDDSDSMAVAEKVLMTMRAAVEESPEITLRASRLGAEVAGIHSGTGAGAPTLSVQREGIGSGFDQRSNSVDYLRITVPFNPPWRRGTNNGLREATDRLSQTGRVSSSLEVAALAGRRWLDLAAETEMAELAESRAGRLEKALSIQALRYELGEVSGSERTQLELELVRERALLRRSETRRLAARQQVEALTLGGFPSPEVGDLKRLVESTATPTKGEAVLEAGLAEAPMLQLAEIQSEVASAEATSERHTGWGSPEVELEWERIPDLGPVDGLDAAGFRIAFPIPIGKQGRQKILAAERRAEAATAERDRLERELTARLGSALGTAHVVEAALASLRATADQIPVAEHSLAEQFRLGAISYVVYLDGLSRLDEVRQAMIESHYMLLAARLELAELLASDAYFPLPALDRKGAR